MVSPAIPRILLLGGHGKVSLLLTPLLLSRGWHVTSMIRNPAQKEDVVATGAGQRGQLDVLVESLEDVGSVEDAAAILKKVGAEWIVWSAGRPSYVQHRIIALPGVYWVYVVIE